MVNEGRPEPMSTSTCTGSAFTPIRAKVRAIANIDRSYAAGPRDWCAQRLDAVTNSLRFARGPGAEIAQPRGMTYARQRLGRRAVRRRAPAGRRAPRAGAPPRRRPARRAVLLAGRRAARPAAPRR